MIKTLQCKHNIENKNLQIRYDVKYVQTIHNIVEPCDIKKF